MTDKAAVLTSCQASVQSHYLHLESRDFDEQSQFLQGWNQHYSQLSAGLFNGYLTHVHLPEVSLFLEFTNRQLHQQGCLDQDTICIGVPMNSMQKGIFCGRSCEQQAVHIYSGREGFEFVSPPNLAIGLIVISRQFLLRHLPAGDQERLLRQCRHARILPLNSQKICQPGAVPAVGVCGFENVAWPDPLPDFSGRNAAHGFAKGGGYFTGRGCGEQGR